MEAEMFNPLDDVDLPYYGQDYEDDADDGFQNQVVESMEQDDPFHDPYFTQNNLLLCTQDFATHLHPKPHLKMQDSNTEDRRKDSSGVFMEHKENLRPIDVSKQVVDQNSTATEQIMARIREPFMEINRVAENLVTDSTSMDPIKAHAQYLLMEASKQFAQALKSLGEQLQIHRVKHEEPAECKVVSTWPFRPSKRIRVGTPDSMVGAQREAYKHGRFGTTMGEFGTKVATGIADACPELKPHKLQYLTNGKGDDTSERGLDPPPGIEIIDVQSDSDGFEHAYEDFSFERATGSSKPKKVMDLNADSINSKQNVAKNIHSGYPSTYESVNKEGTEAIRQSDLTSQLEPQELQEKKSKLGQPEKILGTYQMKHEELEECEVVPLGLSKHNKIHHVPAQSLDAKSKPVDACRDDQHGNWNFGAHDTCPQLKPHQLQHLKNAKEEGKRTLHVQVGIEIIDIGSDSEDLEDTAECKPQRNINLGAASISQVAEKVQADCPSQSFKDVHLKDLEHGSCPFVRAKGESKPQTISEAGSTSPNRNVAENVQSACPSKSYEDVNKERIEAILQNTIAGDEEANLDNDLITIELLKHQRIALAWMEKSELRADCRGGLLADDQGLGKTISAIALILKARPPKRLRYNVEESRSTLIVCPKSLLKQWEHELKEKVAPSVKLSVYIYHEDQRRISSLELCKYDIVLSTYGTICSELQKPSEEDEKKQPPRLRGTLSNIRWFRIILDEAQSIRNAHTKSSRACWGLRAQRRWCLSGTPIQNQIDDLYSYFRFLRYYPYDDRTVFNSEIRNRIQRNHVLGYKRLQVVLNTIMLRRTKATMIDNKPIVKLPSRIVKLEQLDFDTEERQFYNELEFQSCEKFKEYERKNLLRENYMNILVLLLRLRQACNHPILVINSLAKAMNGGHQELAEKNFALSEATDICRKSNDAICAICKELAEEPRMSRCGHIFCTECVHEIAIGNDADMSCPSLGCCEKLEMEALYNLNYDSFQTVGCMLKRFEDGMPSSKIKSIVARLKTLPVAKGITDENFKEKALVFSQWTSMLDLLEPELQKETILFKRMDGRMTIQERDAAVSEFNSNPKVTVLLLSFGAASLGLNLVSACHVVLIDPWWNPAVEDQAIDRTHRVGQKNDVRVSRFTIRKTVEDRILQMQEKKRKIAEMAFGEEGGRSQGRRTKLSLADLRFLFTVQ